MLKRILAVLVLVAPLLGAAPPSQHGPNVKFYTSTAVEPDLDSIHVPVPMKDRVPNRSGNCVWCSIELLGRFAEEPKLLDISLGRGGAEPINVRPVLDRLGIKYKMNPLGSRHKTKEAIEEFFVKAVKIERRGVGVAINNNHMLVCVHYDPDTKTVMVIDNADRKLAVQQWDWESFHRQWDGWCIIIYADKDIIPYKYTTIANRLPIVDMTDVPRKYDKKYIPSP